MNENRFEAVQSSLAALKAVHDPAVQGEAKKLEKNINAIIATNKPMVVAYVEQLKAFDASLLAKYGVPRAAFWFLIAVSRAELYIFASISKAVAYKSSGVESPSLSL